MKNRIPPIDPDHLPRILERLPLQQRVLAYLCLTSGMRISEALSLRWHDIHLATVPMFVEYRIAKTKSGRRAYAPVTTFMAEMLNSFRPLEPFYHDQDFVFMSCKEGGAAISARSANLALNRACQACGLPNLYSTHSYRKTFAERLYKLTHNDIVSTQRALNHQSPASTSHYLAQNDLLLADAITQTATSLTNQCLPTPKCENGA